MRVRLDPHHRAVKATAGNGIFGLVFGAFFGGIPLLMLILFIAVPGDEGEAPPLLVIVPFFSLFIIIGAIVALGRKGVLVDASGPMMVRWWGLLGPMVRRNTDCTGAQLVTLDHEVRVTRSKNGTRRTHVWPVRIEGLAGDAALEVLTPKDPSEGRRLAEGVAKVLQTPLMDRSGDSHRLREPDQLDETVAMRLRREGRGDRDILKPSIAGVAIQRSGRRIDIHLPAPGIGLLVVTAPLMFVPALVFWFNVPSSGDGFDVFAVLPLVFTGLIVGPVLGLGLLRGLRRDRIILDESGVTLRSGTRTKHIGHGEWEELAVSYSGFGRHSGGIRFCSDRVDCTIGSKLPVEARPQLVAWLEQQALTYA